MATSKQEERFQRMIKAAMVEFSRLGFHETSVDVIAERAKVSKTTLYQHFRSKERMFLTVFDHAFHALDTLLIKGMDDLSFADSTREAVRTFMKMAIQSNEMSFFFKIFTTDSNLFDESMRLKMIERFLQHGGGFARKNMQKAQQTREIKKNIPIEVIHYGSFGMMVFVLNYWFKLESPPSIETYADAISEILLNGISLKKPEYKKTQPRQFFSKG